MAEYMDYNDYDYQYQTKKQKRNANIRLIIAILFLVTVVIWTIVRIPKNVRSNFGPVYSSAHMVGEQTDTKNNEFLKFINSYDDNQNISDNNEFEKAFPKIYSLIHMNKKNISKDDVSTFDNNGCYTIAKVYVINRQADSNGEYYDKNKDYTIGEVGVDFYVFKYTTTENFTLSHPQKFSIHYYTRNNDVTPYLCKTTVASSSFKLNYYTLSVKIQSQSNFTDINSTMTFNAGITKSQAENNFFFKKVAIKNADKKSLNTTSQLLSGGELGDTFVQYQYNLKNQAKTAIFEISFDDTMYNKFDSINLGNIKNAKYTIIVN